MRAYIVSTVYALLRASNVYALRLPTQPVALRCNRRAALLSTAAVCWAPPLGAAAVAAADDAAVLTVPSMSDVPYYTILIPLVELDLALQRFEQELAEGGGAATTRVAQALAKFSTGLFSSQNFYLGLASKYVGDIKYDDFDATLVRRDRDARMLAVLAVGKQLDAARSALGDERADATSARAALGEARARLASFLARVPRADAEAARRALAAWNAADADGDGKLSRDEFKKAGLDDEQRVASYLGVWGTTIAMNSRPEYVGRVDPAWFMSLQDEVPAVPEKLKGTTF